MRRKITGILLFVLLGLTIAVFFAGYRPASLAVAKQETADADNDSVKETYVLKDGRLTVSENSDLLWESPADWRIDNFFLADSDNDGVMNINLSLWKPGNFGPSKPFWVKKNDMSVKNHFFVYTLIDNTMKQVWGSSNLEAPNCDFMVLDTDGDGTNELLVIEGEYSWTGNCRWKYLALWKWNGWGFSNEWRSEKGNFSRLEIGKNGEKRYIVIE